MLNFWLRTHRTLSVAGTDSVDIKWNPHLKKYPLYLSTTVSRSQSPLYPFPAERNTDSGNEIEWKSGSIPHRACHHRILCRSRSRGPMRCPRQEYKRGLWERDYIVFSARLKPCACQYGILNGKNRPLIFKNLRKRVNPGPAVVHLSLWLLNPGVGTPGNSWWGCATRFVKPWPDFRPKNVIFHTRFQTWPLGRNYVIIT